MNFFLLPLLTMLLHCTLGFEFERRAGKLVAAVSLTGSNNCSYSAPLTINGETYNILLDTGSSYFAVATTQCSNCDVSPQYSGSLTDPTYTVTYDQGSFVGSNINSLPFTIGDISAQMVAIGITQQTAFFTCSNQYQGIVGLAFSALSKSTGPTFMDTLAAAGVPDGFALQLCDGITGSSTASKTGNFWIGGYDSSFTTSQMQFIAITQESYYNVKVLQITVAGQAVSLSSDINTPYSIIDSGTTQIIFNTQDNYNAVINALAASNIITWSSEITESEITAFWQGATSIPKEYYTVNENFQMSIDFQGTDGETVPISIPVSNFFTFDSAKEITYTQLFGFSTISGEGTIMGDFFFLNYVVFFDRPASRIGFAPGTNCFSAISAQGIDNFASSSASAGNPFLHPIFLCFIFIFSWIFVTSI